MPMPIQLKIRDMRTGDAKVAEFENVDDAETWLRERPQFVEVMGPAREGALSPGDDKRLRAALRPMDDGEKKAVADLDQLAMKKMREMMAKDAKEGEKRLAAQREANRNADPDRLMNIVWERGQGCRNADPADERPVTELIEKAVAAWVAERNTWVHSRNKYLIDANIQVWPGPIPNGGTEDERVERGGQFNTAFGTPPELN